MPESEGPGPDRPAPGGDDLVRELERRIRLLEAADESAFGRFTALDGVLCFIAFVVLPLLLVWWGA